MMRLRTLLLVPGACLVLSFGSMALAWQVPVAAAAPIVAQDASGGRGLSIANPLAGLETMLSPDHLGKLVQDTASFLLTQLVSGLHDLLVTLTQGDNNVITHTPPRMTYQQPLVVDKA